MDRYPSSVSTYLSRPAFRGSVTLTKTHRGSRDTPHLPLANALVPSSRPRATACLLLILCLIVFSQTARADLIITLLGMPGSASMTVWGEGSITSTGSPSAGLGSSFLKVPDATPSWQSANLNIGDYLRPSWTAFGSEGREMELTGDLQLRGEGSATFAYTFDHLRFDNDSAVGGDDLDLRFDSTQSYPDYPDGLILSLSGSSTFSLQDGNTFDDLIPGNYTLTGFGTGGGQSVSYSISQAVPEPSSFILMGIVTLFCFQRRRTRQGPLPCPLVERETE